MTSKRSSKKNTSKLNKDNNQLDYDRRKASGGNSSADLSVRLSSHQFSESSVSSSSLNDLVKLYDDFSEEKISKTNNAYYDLTYEKEPRHMKKFLLSSKILK